MSGGNGGIGIRIGIGYDAHRLTEGRRLVLGGCTIPFEKGLLGHSDADVLVHAVMDALLGACALGDIGKHFPDSDSRYKDRVSLHMLKQVGEMLRRENFDISNIDSVIVAQSPKLADFLPQMKENISQALGIPPASVNVKATTEERMGFTGTGEGMAAHAAVLVSKRP